MRRCVIRAGTSVLLFLIAAALLLAAGLTILLTDRKPKKQGHKPAAR